MLQFSQQFSKKPFFESKIGLSAHYEYSKSSTHLLIKELSIIQKKTLDVLFLLGNIILLNKINYVIYALHVIK